MCLHFAAVRLRPSGPGESGGLMGVSPFTASEPSGVQGRTADGLIAILEVQAKIFNTVLGMTLIKASCIFNGGKADGARASR